MVLAAPGVQCDILRILPLAAGVLALVLLVRHFGLESLTAALTRIAWWQFVLVCLVHGISVVLDTLGWRSTLVADRPPFVRLLAARCAGQAINVITALGGLGGEAIKAWLLRRDIPYDASVPSLILAKTAEVVGQALLLATGILVGWATGVVGSTLLVPMCYLLLVEVIGVGGFIAAAGRGRRGPGGPPPGVGRSRTRRGPCRRRGPGRSTGRTGARSSSRSGSTSRAGSSASSRFYSSSSALHVPASLVTATVIEALGTGVRFATFFVPASLGTLEGAYAAAFAALGWAASDGLAFSLVRRGRQAVWIGLGLAVLGAVGAFGAGRRAGQEPAEPAPARAD